MAKRYNISVPKKYGKPGEEKTAWSTVGTLVQFPATDEKPESFIIELGMFPNTTFKVFEQKPKEAKPEAATEEINPEDIPF